MFRRRFHQKNHCEELRIYRKKSLIKRKLNESNFCWFCQVRVLQKRVSTVQFGKSCKFKWDQITSNYYLLAKIGFDTIKNEPSEVPLTNFLYSLFESPASASWPVESSDVENRPAHGYSQLWPSSARSIPDNSKSGANICAIGGAHSLPDHRLFRLFNLRATWLKEVRSGKHWKMPEASENEMGQTKWCEKRTRSQSRQ